MIDLDIFGVILPGLAVMAWAFWPQWRKNYRRWRQHRDWSREGFGDA